MGVNEKVDEKQAKEKENSLFDPVIEEGSDENEFYTNEINNAK